MNLKFWKKNKELPKQESYSDIRDRLRNDLFIGGGRVGYNPIIDDYFDGEKTPGELGSVLNSKPDYLRLRLRAYDLNLKTDIIKLISGKFFKWVIGTGLKLQAEPSSHVLNMFGVSVPDTFQKDVEALFDLYASSKYSDYKQQDSLHKLASDAFEAAFLGGDVLCIIRFSEYGPTMQVIDGQQVENPMDDKGKGEGNLIINGIEMNAKGQHIAFWVAKNDENNIISHERIKAVNSEGITVAWMVYGLKGRIDHHRGIPVISSILEKVSKLDRFVEASVKKAEETANVVYAFEHDQDSTGENILTQSLSSKKDDGKETTDPFEETGRTAAMLRQSTSSMVLNLTKGSKLVSLSNPGETTFNEFFRAIFVTLCASVDIPEEVALQKYEQNYSSSRAAIKGWEYMVEIGRDKHSDKFYKPFFRAWMEWNILKDNIKAPGFLLLKNNNNIMGIEAYFKCRFTGKNMPHIDPLKEVKAIRALLGDDDVALVSYEQASEMLGTGDWETNFKKYLKEQEIIPQDDTEQNNDLQSGME